MYYTGQEFWLLKKKPPATLEGAVFLILASAFMVYQGASLKPFLTLTDKSPYVWDLTVLGYMLKCAQDVREQTSGQYWARGLVATAIAAFGGGFLAPLAVGHVPVPLREETFTWFLVFAWYITHHVPVISAKWCEIARSRPGTVALTVCFGVFKTQQIFGSIELGAKAVLHEPLLPQSRYFSVPVAAPLLCGFLGGCGGGFLPFDKGLRPIEEGKQWSVSAAFFASVVYYFATRWEHVPQLDAKVAICALRIVGDLFPGPRASFMESVSDLLYTGTNVRSARVPEGMNGA